MSEIRAKYDEEFKKNEVSLSYGSPRSVKEVSEDLGISENLLYRRGKKYKRQRGKKYRGSGAKSIEAAGQKHATPRLRKRIKRYGWRTPS